MQHLTIRCKDTCSRGKETLLRLNTINKYTKNESFKRNKDDQLSLGHLRHVVFRNNSELHGPSGSFVDLERFHRSGIPLDRQRLWNHYRSVFNLLCFGLSFCRKIHRLAGHKAGLSLGHLYLVDRCLPTCHLWLGDHAPGGRGFDRGPACR